MIIHQLNEQQYNDFLQDLRQRAYSEPLDASFTVKLMVADAEYAVKLQPEMSCQIAVLQAHRIDREPEGPQFELITDNAVLFSLLEILLLQGIQV